jgi:hypothetical protein
MAPRILNLGTRLGKVVEFLSPYSPHMRLFVLAARKHGMYRITSSLVSYNSMLIRTTVRYRRGRKEEHEEGRAKK